MMFHSMRRKAHGTGRRQPWQAGYAVRRDWPDGAHELISFRWAVVSAAKLIDRDRQYWRRGPARPQSWAIVMISRRDFDLHAARAGCRSPDCPAAHVASRSEQASR
jgi:hypothetical protein